MDVQSSVCTVSPPAELLLWFLRIAFQNVFYIINRQIGHSAKAEAQPVLHRDGYVGSCKLRSTGHEVRFCDAQWKVMQQLGILCTALLTSVRSHVMSLIHRDKTQTDEIYQITQANNLFRFSGATFPRRFNFFLK